MKNKGSQQMESSMPKSQILLSNSSQPLDNSKDDFLNSINNLTNHTSLAVNALLAAKQRSAEIEAKLISNNNVSDYTQSKPSMFSLQTDKETSPSSNLMDNENAFNFRWNENKSSIDAEQFLASKEQSLKSGASGGKKYHERSLFGDLSNQ